MTINLKQMLMRIVIFGLMGTNVVYASPSIYVSDIVWGPQGVSGYQATRDEFQRQEIPILLENLSADKKYFISVSGSLSQLNTGGEVSQIDALNERAVDRGTYAFERVALSGSSALKYQFYTDYRSNAPLTSNLAAFNRENLIWVYPNQNTANMYMEVFPKQWVPPGIYTDTIQVSLYEAGSGFSQAILQSSRVFKLTIQVKDQWLVLMNQAVLDHSTKNKGSEPLLKQDLGELKSHQKTSSVVTVFSNVPYRLLLGSKNGSKLQRVEDSAALALPYQVMVNGQEYLLSGTSPILVDQSNPTSQVGKPYQVDLILGDASRLLEGTYEDRLLIQFEGL